MVDMSILHQGDRVRIVSHWNDRSGENREGLMDRYLGTIMTIHYVHINNAYMVEDRGRWSWNKFSIAEVVDDDIELATQEELIALLTG